LVGISLASVRVVRVEGFSPVLLLLLGVCVVFGCLFVFLQFFLYFYSFVILCWSSSVWPHQELSVNCFLLNEIRAQARSRKKNGLPYFIILCIKYIYVWNYSVASPS